MRCPLLARWNVTSGHVGKHLCPAPAGTPDLYHRSLLTLRFSWGLELGVEDFRRLRRPYGLVKDPTSATNVIGAGGADCASEPNEDNLASSELMNSAWLTASGSCSTFDNS